MTEPAKPRELDVFEIERDRYVLMCSRDVAVGECVRVVEAEPVERELEALRKRDGKSWEERALRLAKEHEASAREREEMLALLEKAFQRAAPHVLAAEIETCLRKHGRLSDA